MRHLIALRHKVLGEKIKTVFVLVFVQCFFRHSFLLYFKPF